MSHVSVMLRLKISNLRKERLEGSGLKVNEWLHVRSQYFATPEGNLLEFICYDANVGEGKCLDKFCLFCPSACERDSSSAISFP